MTALFDLPLAHPARPLPRPPERRPASHLRVAPTFSPLGRRPLDVPLDLPVDLPVPQRSGFGGRALHLIDLENLVGGADAGADDIARVWATYRYHGTPITADDHLVVGSSRHFAKTAWFVLPVQGVQRRVRDGRNGGELALIDELDLEQTARRFERLVIASGDGEFTATAFAARALGLHVHQVVGRGLSARRLTASVTSRCRLRLGPRGLVPAVA